MTKHIVYITVKKCYQFEIISDSPEIDEIEYKQILSADLSLADEIDEEMSFEFYSEPI